MATLDQIKNYYDATMFAYTFYHGKSNGLHYGFTTKEGQPLDEAIANTNKFLAQKLGLKGTETILDAGCGIGGSSLWLAKTFPKISVTGITLSPKQVIKAKDLARKMGLEQQTNFHAMNFLKTSFPNHSFDVVWAIESICYTPDKAVFLKEAKRILKPGGKLIIADGFLYHKPKNKEEETILRTFYKGFFLDALLTFSEFKNTLAAAGFKKISFWDTTKLVLPTAKRIYWLGFFSLPVTTLAHKLGFLPEIFPDNSKTAMAQFKGLEQKIGGYGVFLAQKES